MTETEKLIRQYQEATQALARHQEATNLAQQTALQARDRLAAVAPDHPLLKLNLADPAEVAKVLGGLKLHPMQMLVEILKEKGGNPLRGVGPEDALLAGSLAVKQVGPGTVTADKVLSRVIRLWQENDRSISR